MKRRKYRVGALALAAAILLPSAARAAEAGGESHGSWLMFAFFVVNFAVFVYVVYRYAASLTRSFFSDRADGIRTNLARAEEALQSARAMARAAAERKAALESEIARIKTDFASEATFQVARIKELAEATAERLRRDSVMTVSAMTDAVRRRLRERIGAAAAARARGIIASGFGADDQSRLIEGFMDKLGQEALG